MSLALPMQHPIKDPSSMKHLDLDMNNVHSSPREVLAHYSE